VSSLELTMPPQTRLWQRSPPSSLAVVSACVACQFLRKAECTQVYEQRFPWHSIFLQIAGQELNIGKPCHLASRRLQGFPEAWSDESLEGTLRLCGSSSTCARIGVPPSTRMHDPVT